MPRLYDAEVMHARLRPKRHDFTHAAFALAVDAATLGSVRGGKFMLGRALSPYCFRDRDFLPPAQVFQPEGLPQDFGRAGDRLDARFRAFVAAQGEPLPARAQITLVAMPRAFGKSYNPAVFLMATVDGALACGVAEVHNTFGERKAWFLGKDCLRQDHGGEAYLQLRTPKRFYVSPFSALDTEFEFTLRLPGERLAITVDHYEDGHKTLTSAWTGRQVPLTDLRLLWLTLKSPLLILKVITLIHLHAAWLWLAKRLPFRRKGEDIADQRDLRHPTPELTGRHD
jgi:DUF1365 family protein